MRMLKGVNIMVNYPDNEEVDAAIPDSMTVEQLGQYIQRLIEQEPEMTSFVLVAALTKPTLRNQRGVEGNHRIEPEPTSETIGERLRRIYPEHYDTICRYIDKCHDDVLSQSCSRFIGGTSCSTSILSYLFLWSNTPEGYAFWEELAKREYKQ